jgi:hypothetical protein
MANALTDRSYLRPTEDEEWMAGMREQNFLHQPYARQGPTMTTLSPPEEAAFRQWVAANRVPFNPNDPIADYDMRRYWRDLASHGARETATNPNDNALHYPDTYKTPYHQSFSAESLYATPEAPRWVRGDRLQRPDGKVVFDEPAAVRHRRMTERR